jgi:aryl-alcohol dehydrogenase-like predicted oxidoreductase
MKYSTLGKTGTAVSALALGTMDFGSLTPELDAHAILDAYVEAGGNFLDTSNVYNGGLVEQILGRWFAARPAEVTDRVVLATKGRFSPAPDVNGPGSSRRALTRSLDGSLRRLGLDHVDLYQLHAWDPITPIEETLSFLDAAVKSGKVTYVGLSNFTGWQLQLTISTARAMGVELPVTLQQQYSLLSRESEWEVVPAALHNGIGMLPWSPLAGGFLAGKYRRGVAPDKNTRAGSANPLYQWVSAEYASSDRNWATIDTVTRIAEELGATASQVALRWLMDQPAITAPIVGARSVAQLTDNLGAVDIELTDEQRTALDNVSRPTPGGYPYGGFGNGQRYRSLEGSNPFTDLVGKGSDAPTGRA